MPVPQLDPLHEQLLRVALLPSDEAIAEWESLTAATDVGEITDRRARKLFPLVARALTDAQIDDPVLPALHAVAVDTAATTHRLMEDLRDALAVLDAAGVAHLALKGVPLVATCYQDPGLRPMSDVDLLVHQDQAETTDAALVASGWSCRVRWSPRDINVRPERNFAAPGNGTALDMHWRLVPWVTGSRDGRDPELWDRAGTIPIGDRTTLSPDPPDLLLHVILHAYRSGWNDVPRWVGDVVVLLRATDDFDWDRFVGRTRTGRVVPPVLDALTYTRDCFAAPVPEAVLAELSARPMSRRIRHKYRVASREIEHEASSFAGEWTTVRVVWARSSLGFSRRTAARVFRVICGRSSASTA